MKFTLRSLSTTDTSVVETFIEALHHDTGQIISWDGTETCCCLDLDDIMGIDLTALIPLIRPTPAFAWVSRSGVGLHAIYFDFMGYRADELAALAVLTLRWKFPQLQRFELLKHTFRPPGKWHKFTQTVELGELERMLGKGTPDDGDIQAYLDTHGFTVGSRYPHSRCPIAPSADSKRDPVVIYESGIYCHVCQANGIGWYSFSRINAGNRRSDFAIMVRYRTHWEQAKLIMRGLTELSDRLNERIYGAALVYIHGPEVRDAPIFFPERNLIRLNNWWGTIEGELYNNKVSGMISALPVAQYKDAKGKVKTRQDIVTRLQQTVNLTDVGYPSINSVKGMRIHGHYMRNTGASYSIVLQNPLLTNREYEGYRPRFVDASRRDVDKAWELLEGPFPGINRKAIELLICARGISEGQVGLPPFLYLSGPSGAAKTSSVLIAAAIVGDWNTSIVWTNNIERTRQGILAGKLKGSYVTINEILKQARKANVQFQCAMDDILNLTPDSVSHEMYIGPVPLGNLPVLIWTDTEVPGEIRDSVQLARRLVHIHMPNKQEWERSIYESGIMQIERLRITSMEYADACNEIVSDVIDRYFQEQQDLRSIAEQLGFHTLSDEQTIHTEDTLTAFYRATCEAPDLDDKHRMRWSGEGWKLVDLNDVNAPLTGLWDALRDSENPRTSRRCSEANWPNVLRVAGPVEFELQSHGNKIVIRFVKRGRVIQFNGGIK